MDLVKIKGVNKIAILRANAIGDFIVTLPAIKAIRNTYPEAEIVLLGKPWHKEFLKHKRTPVDRVIVIPESKGISEEKDGIENKQELEFFFTEIQKEQFDIAFNFQGKGITANPFIKKIGAKLTAGLTCPEAERLDRSVNYYYYQSEVVRYMEVTGLVGAVSSDLEPEIKVLLSDKEEASRFMKQNRGKPFIVLNSFGKDHRRIWPFEKFAKVGDILSQRNYQVVFTGNASERTLAGSIISEMNYPALNACGSISLGGLTGLLSESSLVISNDSGPLHLARAVGARTVGIYWAPNLINWGPLTRTDHRPVVSWKLACPLCGIIPNAPYPFEPQSKECNHSVSFVKEIAVEEVMEQVNDLLKT